MNEQTPSPLVTGLEAALRALDVKGTPAELARRLGLSRVALYNWQGVIPLKRLADVERVTGVPREILRPDYIEAIVKVVEQYDVPLEALRPSLVRKISEPKTAPKKFKGKTRARRVAAE